MLEPHDVWLNVRRSKIIALLGFSSLVVLICVTDAGYSPKFSAPLRDLPYGDKIGHFMLYGLTALLLAFAFPRAWRLGRLRIPYVIIAFLCFTLAEEWSQSLFASRTADPLDVLAGCSGILLATWTAARVKTRLERRQKGCSLTLDK